jgi:hypothetical protein
MVHTFTIDVLKSCNVCIVTASGGSFCRCSVRKRDENVACKARQTEGGCAVRERLTKMRVIFVRMRAFNGAELGCKRLRCYVMETGGLLKAESLTERVHKVFGALTPVGATNADAALGRGGEFIEKLLTTL